MIKPDYNGNSIVNLMSSIKQVLGGKSKYKKLEGLNLKFKNNLVLFVIDGLGYEYLTKNCKNSFLLENLKGKMTSVFPSSTAAATTTLMTGLAPLEHGISGWRIFDRKIGGIIHPLPFEFWQKKVSLEKTKIEFPKIYSKDSFYEDIKVESTSIAQDELACSSFSLESQRGAKIIEFGKLEELFSQLKKQCQNKDRKFIYTYVGEFDYLFHRGGKKSEKMRKYLSKLDGKIKKLAKELKGTGTTLIITSDHGQLENKFINLSKDKKIADCLFMPLCGETRYAYCYIKKGEEKEFEKILSTKYKKYLDFFKSQDLIEKGMFGLFDEHKDFLGRVGDYTIIMKENYALDDFFTLAGREPFKSNHGGLHKDEMLVPLIKIYC